MRIACATAASDMSKAMRLAYSSAAPPMTPERQVLSAEIMKARLLDQRHVALTAAVQAAKTAVYDAIDALEAADKAVESAQSDGVQFLVDSAAGVATDPPRSIKAAKVAAADAADELQIRIAARDQLIRQLEDIERYPVDRSALRKAAMAVLQAEAGDAAMRVVERVEIAQRELVTAGSALQWLVNAGMFPMETGEGRGNYLEDGRIRQASNRLLSPSTSWNELARLTELRGNVIWAECLSQLMEDATASVPVVT
jgi:hypothetical protein